MQKWLSGRRRTIGNRVGVDSVSRVQIPPSAPRRSKRCIACSVFFSQSALVPRLLRSKPQPLTRGCDSGSPLRGSFVPLRGKISILTVPSTSSRTSYRPRRLFFALCTKMPAIKTGPEHRSGPVSRFITVNFRASPTLRHRPAPTLSPDQSAVRRRSRCIR